MSVVDSYGGGTNSTAVLVGLHECGERPDFIVFCDTGGEKPHTYAHIAEVSAWCAQIGFPPITIVKGSQPQQLIDGSLEAECIRLGYMPSKAYGFGTCSQKWKIDPFMRWIKAQQFSEPPVRLIGFDADEPERMDRAERSPDKNCVRRYPLIEWGWGREECVAAIARAGLSQPGKSACFFCPSSKKHEILELRERYPDLLDRALAMEARAMAGEGKAPISRGGLGRSFSWAEFLAEFDEAAAKPKPVNQQMELLLSSAAVPEIDCGCYDG